MRTPGVAADVSRRDIGRLVIRCTDRPGIVAAVSGFLAEQGANIISLDQHSTAISGGTFLQRLEFHLLGLPARRDALEGGVRRARREADGHGFRLTDAARPKRVAIMVSKQDHCLLDLLWRSRRGELHMSIPMVISNHPRPGDQVRPFAVPFFHIPVTAGRSRRPSDGSWSCCPTTST